MSDPLLEVEELDVQYETGSGMLTAVSDASFSIDEGEYFGLAGESGCGKSTMADALLGALDENGEITSGKIKYKGTEIQDYSEQQLNDEIRWKEISWIPQGSLSSLNPLETVKDQALELARTHTDLSDEAALEKFKEMFEVVGLQESRIHDYPHQFSGGMQQRTIIALALFLDPALLIADEPTTALDVIMQDQIFKYLDAIQEQLDVSMLLITHDISVIFESCDRMGIMHAGQLAEVGTVTELFDSPRHPYPILLKEAYPDMRYPNRQLNTIPGDPPQLMGEVNHCTFADRCPWAVDECRDSAPALEPTDDATGDSDHMAACFRKDEVYKEYEDERAPRPSGD
jgi:oligopeptide/dipeptide ABC transporter ATP-binding protein